MEESHWVYVWALVEGQDLLPFFQFLANFILHSWLFQCEYWLINISMPGLSSKSICMWHPKLSKSVSLPAHGWTSQPHKEASSCNCTVPLNPLAQLLKASTKLPSWSIYLCRYETGCPAKCLVAGPGLPSHFWWEKTFLWGFTWQMCVQCNKALGIKDIEELIGLF